MLQDRKDTQVDWSADERDNMTERMIRHAQTGNPDPQQREALQGLASLLALEKAAYEDACLKGEGQARRWHYALYFTLLALKAGGLICAAVVVVNLLEGGLVWMKLLRCVLIALAAAALGFVLGFVAYPVLHRGEMD